MKLKSVGTAVVLTIVLGPLGLFYVSGWQAILLTLFTLVGFPILLGADFTTAGIIFVPALVWVLSVILGVTGVLSHNQAIKAVQDDNEARHQELLAATHKRHIENA